MSDEEHRLTNPAYTVVARPSAPPGRSRSGAAINTVIVRAMESHGEACNYVHEQADRLLEFLKSAPPPAARRNGGGR